MGDPKKVDTEAGGNVDHNHSHGQWAADGTQETIGDYMADKLNETPRCMGQSQRLLQHPCWPAA